jgi:hypothetical protein
MAMNVSSDRKAESRGRAEDPPAGGRARSSRRLESDLVGQWTVVYFFVRREAENDTWMATPK